MLVEMIMTARFFIVVLAVSLALGEGGSTQPSLSSASASLENESEPIKQVQMESLHKVLEEQWTVIAGEETPSAFDQEEIINRVDSPSLSPPLAIVPEAALSSAVSDHTPVIEDLTTNMLNSSEDSIVGSEATGDPRPLQEAATQGSDLARVLQDLGMTEENSTVLDTLGPDFHGDPTFNEIMAALDEAKEMEAWEEEKEAWKKAKDGRLKEIGDGYNWRVHTYPSEDKNLEEWEKWVQTSVEKAQQEEEEFELWNDHQNFVVTFFTCLLIVAALAVVTHQCYIERKLKRRASVEMQASTLPVKEPLMQPMFVIVPQQLAGKQHLY